MTLDSCGNLYIADNQNKRVRKVAFNPNCSAVDTTDTTTAVYNIAVRSKIEIYPNPAQNVITIKGLSNTKDVAIINAVGQTVITQSCNTPKATIDVSGLKGGVYFISVRDRKTGGVVRGNFVKE